MIHNIKTAIVFYCQLWWAKRKRESFLNDIEAQTKNAKTENERDEIWQSNSWEIDLSQQIVQKLQSRYYGDKARRKGIPTPQNKDDWEHLISTKEDRVM